MKYLLRGKIKKFVVLGMTCIMVFTNTTYAGEKYDPDDATAYAKKYWNGYNSAYPKYDSDCTNFVSQCVCAGGIEKKNVPESKINVINIGKTYKTKSYWGSKYYKNKVGNIVINEGWVSTSTWTIVDQADGGDSYGFQDYMLNVKKKEVSYFKCTKKNIKNMINQAKEGDVLQIKFGDDKRYTHSYYIGSKRKNAHVVGTPTDIYLYAHTTNRGGDGKKDTIWKLWDNEAISRNDSLALISMGD